MNLVRINLKGEKIQLSREYLRLSGDVTVGGLMSRIRRLAPELRPEEALFVFFHSGKTLEPMSKQLKHIAVGKAPIECLVTRESVFG